MKTTKNGRMLGSFDAIDHCFSLGSPGVDLEDLGASSLLEEVIPGSKVGE